MEEDDIGFSESDMFLNPINGEDPLISCSMDSIFDEILKDTHHHVCTHTHTCKPPVPGPGPGPGPDPDLDLDLSHTHTCFHVHTKILSAPADRSAESADKSSCAKKQLRGNRDAVKKYREKRKAHAASLAEEAAKLRSLNQQLMRRLQGEAALEAEAARLRCLLVDIRGRIEGEIRPFPYRNLIPMRGGGESVSMHFVNHCDFRCDDQAYCGYPGTPGKNVEGSNVVLDRRGSRICDGKNVEGSNVVLDRRGSRICDVGSVRCIGSKNFVSSAKGKVMHLGCSSNE